MDPRRIVMAAFIATSASVVVASVLILIGWASFVAPALAQTVGRDDCRSLPDPVARLKCYDEQQPAPLPRSDSPATPSEPGRAPAPERSAAPSAAGDAGRSGLSSQPGGQSRGPTRSEAIGAWRLVRTPDPTGGKDAISIMRPADLTGSDPELVGLMLRCGSGDIEVLTVVIPPLPPRATPAVTIRTPAGSNTYEARVTPPGSAILLSANAARDAKAVWPTASALTVEIAASETQMIKGVIPVDGLGAAVNALTTACSTR